MATNKIRNIIQTTQDREIIKTAPDMVVYIESLPFLLNPYIKDGTKAFTTVNFNDFITAISTSYAVDSLIPSGSINLMVPNGFKHLFKAPGGGLIIDLMSEIRIYAKSYFFSESGNTVYRRVFNGMIKTVDYNDGLTSLDITIGITGLLHFMELMQTDLAPGNMSNSSMPLTPMNSNQSEMNPFQVILDEFWKQTDFSGIIFGSVIDKKIENTQYKDSLKKNYVNKWNHILSETRKYIRLYGVSSGEEKAKTIKALGKQTNEGSTSSKPVDPQKGSQTTTPTKAQSDKAGVGYMLDHVRKFTFDYSVGSIGLLGGKIVSRLERIRQMIELIGYEGYQDLDGTIIMKPPSYNLDCTIVGDKKEELADENIYEHANPYIIHLSEILNENYQEDEGGIRRTVFSIQGNWDLNVQASHNNLDKIAVVRAIDIGKMSRFGIRDEPPKFMGFLGHDCKQNFAFAHSEMVKANKNWRTYHVTIPLRPELRLGLPIFVPHLDMYAYVSGISISYSVGGKADMSLTCNFIRKRPQIPQVQTVTEGGEKKEVLLYVTQPNLVHKWSKGSSSQIVNATQGGIFGTAGKLPSNSLVNDPATLFNPAEFDPSQYAVRDYMRKKIGNLYETFSDGPEANWKIQNDSDRFFDGVLKDGKKTKLVSCDGKYLDKCTQMMPYTDEKGYEVISPMPWGRYATLNEAIYEFTREGYVDLANKDKNIKEAAQALKTTSAFLFAGFAIPKIEDPAPLIKSELAKNVADSASQFNSQASKEAAINKAKEASGEKVLEDIRKFDKSNLISFEMKFTTRDRTNSDNIEAAAAATEVGVTANSGSMNNPTSEASIGKKVQAFLFGEAGLDSTGAGNYYKVSTLPQQTALGGFSGLSGISGPAVNFANSVRQYFNP